MLELSDNQFCLKSFDNNKGMFTYLPDVEFNVPLRIPLVASSLT